jgi:phage FluMu gp28-like protein
VERGQPAAHGPRRGRLFVGQDFARVGDLSVQAVFEKIGRIKRMIGLLIMEDMRIKAQFDQFDAVARCRSSAAPALT